MAGSLMLIDSEHLENQATTIRDQWEIQFSRFFGYPLISSTCPDLAPLSLKWRNRRPKGTWISSSSSTAFLRLLSDFSTSEEILTVCFRGKNQEEHFVSNLHFSWPQVSCISGFPPRGSRAVFVSYKDCIGEIQRFALRFLTNYEAETFINAVKGILMSTSEIELPTNGSEISSQSEFTSSNGPPQRAHEELSNVTPVHSFSPMPLSLNYKVEQQSHAEQTTSNHSFEDAYIPQMPLSLNYEVEQHKSTQQTTLNDNLEGIIAALPPSFTSLLTNCCSEVKQGRLAAPVISRRGIKGLLVPSDDPFA